MGPQQFQGLVDHGHVHVRRLDPVEQAVDLVGQARCRRSPGHGLAQAAEGLLRPGRAHVDRASGSSPTSSTARRWSRCGRRRVVGRRRSPRAPSRRAGQRPVGRPGRPGRRTGSSVEVGLDVGRGGGPAGAGPSSRRIDGAATGSATRSHDLDLAPGADLQAAPEPVAGRGAGGRPRPSGTGRARARRVLRDDRQHAIRRPGPCPRASDSVRPASARSKRKRRNGTDSSTDAAQGVGVVLGQVARVLPRRQGGDRDVDVVLALPLVEALGGVLPGGVGVEGEHDALGEAASAAGRGPR